MFVHVKERIIKKITFNLLTLVKSDLILLEGLSGEGDSLSFNLESMSLTNYSCIETNMGFGPNLSLNFNYSKK